MSVVTCIWDGFCIYCHKCTFLACDCRQKEREKTMSKGTKSVLDTMPVREMGQIKLLVKDGLIVNLDGTPFTGTVIFNGETFRPAQDGK